MSIFFLASSLFAFLFASDALEILCGAKCGCMVVCLSNDPFFLLILEVFSIALCIQLGLPHPLALGLSHCICGQPLDPMRIHLLSCAHGGERMVSHDVM